MRSGRMRRSASMAESSAEVSGDQSASGQAEAQERGRDQQRGRQLDGGIAPADAGPARATATTQDGVGNQRHVVVPRDLRAARGTRGARLDERAPFGQASSDDVEKTPERERGREDQSGERDIHAGLYRRLGCWAKAAN
jgi:hypothetical protein